MASRVDCFEAPLVSRDESLWLVVRDNEVWGGSVKDDEAVAEEDASAGMAGDGDAVGRALERSKKQRSGIWR